LIRAVNTGRWVIGAVSESESDSGRIELRREPDGVYVDRADPVMWFAKHSLDMIKAEPFDDGWTFDGTHVTLDAANGRWVWKLTGRSRCHDYGIGLAPLVLVEAVWPD
jgi:hypothetical protein